MKTRKLRNLEVSAIGYGCMGLSHGYGSVPERIDSIRLIRQAYDLGCTFFDTADFIRYSSFVNDSSNKTNLHHA
jgi:aryl-alcohol dehydrogenase-like predicted oxidoreductase